MAFHMHDDTYEAQAIVGFVESKRVPYLDT